MFNCDSCGECCKNLNKSSIYDFLHTGDGICLYLVDNLCSIYHDRPLLCRIDESYYSFFEKEMTMEEYYRENEDVCSDLKKIRNKK